MGEQGYLIGGSGVVVVVVVVVVGGGGGHINLYISLASRCSAKIYFITDKSLLLSELHLRDFTVMKV